MTLMRLEVYEKKTNRHDIITYVHVSLYFIHRSFSNFYVPTIKKNINTQLITEFSVKYVLLITIKLMSIREVLSNCRLNQKEHVVNSHTSHVVKEN